MASFDVLLFASYADSAGTPLLQLELASGATVTDLVRAVREAAPSVSLPERPLVAVNHRYAAPEQVLSAGDEVALIPPVAGG